MSFNSIRRYEKRFTRLMLDKINLLLERKENSQNCVQFRVEIFVKNNCLDLLQLEGITTLYIRTHVDNFLCTHCNN